MHPEFRALYTEAVLDELAPRYGVRREALHFIGGFEAFVYGFSREARPYVLKITHTLVYPRPYLEALLAWQAHLAAAGVTLAAVVPSLAGQLVEEVPAPQGAFMALVYDRAPGERIQPGDRAPALYHAWGRLVGRMHASTARYGARQADLPIPGPEGTVLPLFRALALPDHAWYFERLDALWQRLDALPRTRESFGLIHADLHTGNLHWDGHTLTAFDFDDTHWSWYANDVAIVLYYEILAGQKAGTQPAAVVQACLPELLAGYREEAAFDPTWALWLHDFMRLRRLVLYAALRHAFPGPDVPEREGEVMQRLKAEIQGDLPVVDLDFMAFC